MYTMFLDHCLRDCKILRPAGLLVSSLQGLVVKVYALYIASISNSAQTS